MIDVGLNLLAWAMDNGVGANKADNLITSYIRRAGDPYSKLRWDGERPPKLSDDVIAKLAEGIGIDTEWALCEPNEAVNRLHHVINQCDDEHFHVSGTAFMDDEGTCILHLSATVDAADSARMQLNYAFVDIFSPDGWTRKAAARFLVNGQWVEFSIDPELAEHDYIWENIDVHPDFDALNDGLSLFEKGPVALAEHLRLGWSSGENPWKREDGAEGEGIELYTVEPLPASYSARYRASIGSEEYDILFTIDEEKIWEIRSVWDGRFTFDVYWVDVDDVWLQLIVQNAYETYDTARQIVDDVMGRFEQPAGETPPEPSAEADVWGESGLAPDYDITTYRSYSRPVEPIHVNDLVVRSAIRTCGDPEHEIREIIAVVCVFVPGTGIVEVAVDAFCCPQCKRYFILERDFAKLKNRGKLCCRVVTRTGKVKNFIPQGSAGLSEQSFFNSLGYNVGKQDDLSPDERRTILDFAISNNLKSQKATIGFLQWLIDFNGKRANMDDAVEKWRSDIRYLITDHDTEVERVKIDRIFLAETQWQ